jgi:alkaline phosphatase D
LLLGALPIAGRRLLDAQATPFRHGVASGDPQADRVVIWTRVTPPAPGAVEVAWVVAADPMLQKAVARGTVPTGVERDYTVKVDVTGLKPATSYYYGFHGLGGTSPVGRTRTSPSGPTARVRLAVASCSNLPWGYFNAYGRIAERADLDAVLHLGDYLYEYANAQFGDGSRMGRVPEPDKEMVALSDYRTRHAQYKLDPDLQEAHRQHPFIVVWDDHELTNDTWRDGAENHDPDQGEGDWSARRDAAIQAYFEWMPIRETPSGRLRIYRTVNFGDLADLVMLDTRLVGRDQQAASRDDVRAIELPSRSLLGAAQEAWLAGELTSSTRSRRAWQLLGQQVMFAPQAPPGTRGVSVDSWDGYRASRDRVFEIVERVGVPNFVVLTGDVHSSWAYDLPKRPYDNYDAASGRGSLGVELVGTSITSPSGLGAGPEGEKQIANIRSVRPHLHYADGRYRGYIVVDVTPQRLQADYYYVRTVEERNADERFAKGFVCASGSRHLVESGTPAAPKPGFADPAP